MCGLAGFLSPDRRLTETELSRIARRMSDTLHHRGPDSSGIWSDPEAGIALGHRRLSIIDLSPEGDQPMASASGRFVISYNGEIYNFPSLRRELEGIGFAFRGHSDTEVLLAAIDAWGLDAALPKLAGMFAFALWDRMARTLHLVRDRLGKKPLYYGRVGRDLVFASELKAFYEHPAFAPEIDRAAQVLLLRHGYVPAPYSIYRGVFKLPPAGWLSLPTQQEALQGSDLCDRVRFYWSAREVAERGLAEPAALSEQEAVDQVSQLIDQGVRERMMADVPLGALLSGGIDSSTVVAFMQQHASRPVKTFSIGFREMGYDEAADAGSVARHLGTDHTVLYVTPDQAQAVIPRLPEIYDEPFADRSQIPTFLVAQLARRHVTVALSGDGGDEVFGGYNRHFYGPWLWRRIGAWPRSIRARAAGLITAIPPAGWDAAAGYLYRFLPRSSHQPMPGYRVHKIAGLMAADGPQAIYRRLTSYWHDSASLVIDGYDHAGADLSRTVPEGADFAHTMMYLDEIGYLPDDILVKVDRASMAVSLEVRAPLLDHRLVEFAWRLPGPMKIRQRLGKWILRQVLERYVPRQLVDRPKQGFEVPIDAWLRGPLRDWAETMLDPKRLATESFFASGPIRAVWSEHLRGARNHGEALWAVLMFQAWHEHWRDRSGTTARGNSQALSVRAPGEQPGQAKVNRAEARPTDSRTTSRR
jgi:asparagine synthase (glutamine-hydrolysing)